MGVPTFIANKEYEAKDVALGIYGTLPRHYTHLQY